MTDTAIPADVEADIMARLGKVETDHDVTVLYACESGSRSWGFASPDSDFDVRFIYARPQAWYLSFDVDRRRDVIEYAIVDDIDLNGWDIRKAMHLFCRTNGALLEWLHSPIRYIERGDMAARMRAVAPTAFNATALCYHYLHMARGNYRDYLKREQVRLKKYFYVLRPLLAIRYIERFAAPPPVAFDSLMQAVAPGEIHDDLRHLLEVKRSSYELGLGAPVASIDAFIRHDIERHGDNFKGRGRPNAADKRHVRESLNALFRETVSGHAPAPMPANAAG